MFAKKLTAKMYMKQKGSGIFQREGRMSEMAGTANTRVETVNAKICFDKQLNGYDRAQVDSYIESLTDAYQTAYDEYNAKCEAYDQLLENLTVLETREQNRPSEETISNTLLKAEAFSKKIIDDARVEAEKIKEGSYIYKAAAKIQAQKILDDAAGEAARLKNEAQAALESVNAEAAKAQEKAQRMFDDVSAEVARIESRANRNLEQANEKIARMANEIQGLLTPRALQTQARRKPD